MKKLVACVLAVWMLWCVGVLAEGDVQTVDVGVVTRLASEGQAILLDDGRVSEYALQIIDGEDGMDGYRLSIDGMRVAGEAVELTGELYALRTGDADSGVLLMVSEYGPSDDPLSYIYYYNGERLEAAGGIPALPDGMTWEDGVIHCDIRASVLYTWFREADFALAYDRGYMQYERAPKSPQMVEVPRDSYPMGTLVTTKVDLPLSIRPYGDEVAVIVPAGTEVALTATDDRGAVHVKPIEYIAPENDGWYCDGWVQLSNPVTVLINGEEVYGGDVFDGLFYAD